MRKLKWAFYKKKGSEKGDIQREMGCKQKKRISRKKGNRNDTAKISRNNFRNGVEGKENGNLNISQKKVNLIGNENFA